MATSNCLYKHRSCHTRSRLLVFLVFSLLLGPEKAASASLPEPPEISPNQEEWVQDTGTPLSLTCRATSPVAWCTDSTFITEDYEELYEADHEKPYISILTIRSVTIYHVGYFSCVYSTTENKEKNNCDPSDPTVSSLYLYVKDLENLLVFPSARLIQGEVGWSVVLPCKPTFPDVKVALYKDHDLSNAEYNPRTGFLIKQVTVKDNEGIYLCSTTYGNKTQDFFFFMDVINVKGVNLEVPLVEVQGEWQEDTRFETDLLVYYVEQGTDVNLTCRATGENLPTAYRLEWSNNPQQNKTGRHRTIRDTRKQLFYEIRDAQPEDSGIYSCWPKLQNFRQTPLRLNLTVIAKDATYISATIYTTNVTRVEDPVRWKIIYIAYPEPNFKWMKDGEVLRDSENLDSPNQKAKCEMQWSRRDGSLVLSLHQPTVTDNGKYTVEASLPGTNITTVTTMFLMIPGEPENVQIKSKKHMHKEKTSFCLTCSAYGYPKPNITIHFTPYNAHATEGARVYNQLERRGMDADKDGMAKRTMHWMGVAEQPGWYHCVAENEFAAKRSQNWSFLLTEFDSELTISLELKIDGKVTATENTKSVMVVEGDNMALTCRANKQTTKPPLTWKLDGTDLTEVKDAWDMEVHEDETCFSLLSTVSTHRLKMMADSFILTCSDSGVSHTSLSFVFEDDEVEECPPPGNAEECSPPGPHPSGDETSIFLVGDGEGAHQTQLRKLQMKQMELDIEIKMLSIELLKEKLKFYKNKNENL